MNKLVIRFSIVTLLLCAVLGSTNVLAQRAQGMALIRAAKPKMVLIESPTYKVKKKMPNPSSNVSRQEWMQIAVSYKTSKDWLDELRVTYYVRLEPKKGGPHSKYKLLRGSVSYVNVKKGSHKSVMYLHPSTLSRYGKPKKVAAVFTMDVKGRPVEVATDKQAWWTKLQPEPGLLLKRTDTPFAMLNNNEYEALRFDVEKR